MSKSLIRRVTAWNRFHICRPLILAFAVMPFAAARAGELELHHADFHARVGMKVYAVVGDAPQATALTATLTGGPGGEQVVFDKKDKLAAEEAITLNFRELPKGTYTLTVTLLDKEGKSLKSAVRQFEKPYDGMPRVGLNENNALCVRGKPFFPVSAWCIGSERESEIKEWSAYVNTLQGVGFTKDQWTIEGCRKVLDLAKMYDKLFIGPVSGSYWPKGSTVSGSRMYGKDAHGKTLFERYADHEKIAAYVDALKDHPSLLLWNWQDEPELGEETFTPPEEVRKWTLTTHARDPQHPVLMGNGGAFYARPVDNWGYRRILTYTYQHNEIPGPHKVPLTDVISQDEYPIAYQNDKNYTHTIDSMCLGMDRMVEMNHNLTGFMACVETCKMAKTGDIPAPTPAEIRLLCWANIIHGARGLTWFHYFTKTPEENLAEMGRFLEQITRLTPAVCGPAYTGTITKTEKGGGRIDFMATQEGSTVTLFSANLRRDAETATFTFGKAPKRVTVVDENRSLEMKDKELTDRFAPLAVHIYRVEL